MVIAYRESARLIVLLQKQDNKNCKKKEMLKYFIITSTTNKHIFHNTE